MDNLLGRPSEQYVIQEIKDLVAANIRIAHELLEYFEGIDVDNLEELMLDSGKKETIIKLLDPLKKVHQNMTMNTLIPLIAQTVLERKKV